MLIVLDAKTGYFISDTAREDVTRVANSKDKSKMMELITKWKTTESVPISEAKLGGNQSVIQSIIMFFAKNPMMIFGLFYIYRWAMKNMAKWSKGASGGGPAMVMDDVAEPDDVPNMNGGHDDSEF